MPKNIKGVPSLASTRIARQGEIMELILVLVLLIVLVITIGIILKR